MPHSLKGKKLSKHEHSIWKSAFEGSQGSADNPGAVATAAVLKHRAKSGSKKGFKKRG